MASPDTDWILNLFMSVDMFSALSITEMTDVIKHLSRYQFKKGKTIVKQGAPGDSFFIVCKGKVKVLLKKGLLKTVQVRELGPGQFFGEMSLLLDQPRSATVVAAEDTDCFVLFKTDFQNLVRKNPAFANILKSTSEKRSFELRQK